MPSRNIKFFKNQVYHVYNRAVNKQSIFFEKRDYERFVDNMAKYNNIYDGIRIYSRSVMPNHFHLILKSSNGGEKISEFMRKLQQSYAMYFKIKYRSLSPDLEILKYHKVFEGRFKAKFLKDEKYLNQAIYYVAMNPIKHGIAKKIEDWPFTAYHQLSIKGINLDESYFKDWEF